MSGLNLKIKKGDFVSEKERISDLTNEIVEICDKEKDDAVVLSALLTASMSLIHHMGYSLSEFDEMLRTLRKDFVKNCRPNK